MVIERTEYICETCGRSYSSFEKAYLDCEAIGFVEPEIRPGTIFKKPSNGNNVIHTAVFHSETGERIKKGGYPGHFPEFARWEWHIYFHKNTSKIKRIHQYPDLHLKPTTILGDGIRELKELTSEEFNLIRPRLEYNYRTMPELLPLSISHLTRGREWDILSDYEKLERKLKAAVLTENFEEAAMLRDRINELITSPSR